MTHPGGDSEEFYSVQGWGCDQLMDSFWTGKTRSDETHSNWNKGNNKTTAEINNIGNKKTLENNQ